MTQQSSTTTEPTTPRPARKPRQKAMVQPKKPRSKRMPKTAPPPAAPLPAAATVEAAADDGWTQPLANTSPFIKWAFEGFGKDGKSTTAGIVAIGLHRRIQSTKPICIIDTENGAGFLMGRFQAAGITARRRQTRSLADVVETINRGVAGAWDILIIDGLTHIWEDFVATYKAQFGVDDLGVKGWMAVKAAWHTEWAHLFTHSRLHILFTVRSGDDYATFVDDNGHAESMKLGVKMRAEAETRFEPDLIVKMKRVDMGTHDVIRAKAVGRTGSIDGQTFDNPTYADFSEAIDAKLKDAVNGGQPVEEASSAVFFVDHKERGREQRLLLADIKAELHRVWSSNSAEGKQARANTMHQALGTASWPRIERMDAASLRAGLQRVREIILGGGPSQLAPTSAATMGDQVLHSIRCGLTMADDPAHAQHRWKALAAARALAAGLFDPHKQHAADLIAEREASWSRASGGAGGSGGKPEPHPHPSPLADEDFAHDL